MNNFIYIVKRKSNVCLDEVEKIFTEQKDAENYIKYRKNILLDSYNENLIIDKVPINKNLYTPSLIGYVGAMAYNPTRRKCRILLKDGISIFDYKVYIDNIEGVTDDPINKYSQFDTKYLEYKNEWGEQKIPIVRFGLILHTDYNDRGVESDFGKIVIRELENAWDKWKKENYQKYQEHFYKGTGLGH